MGKYSGYLLWIFLLLSPVIGLYAQTRQAVMVKGNLWINDNPGFGTGTVNALYGEYRVEIPGIESHAHTPAFTVRVCGNPRLVGGAGWQSRPGGTLSELRNQQMLSTSLVQRQEDGNLLIGYQFSGVSSFGEWSVIFCFPRAGNADASLAADAAVAADAPAAPNPLNDVAINRLINSWNDRFRYFVSVIRVTSDLSLPAVVTF